MGSLRIFNMKKIVKEYNVKFFFETGTWLGEGLNFASYFAFSKLVSCEIIEPIFKKAIKRFENNRKISIVHSDSITAVSSQLSSLNDNCFFWLDAHFPGAEEGLNDYNDELREIYRLPLEKELEIISTRNNIYNDVIIIDDLRIYENGGFESGNLPLNIKRPSVSGVEFIYKLFDKTHDILRCYKNEGYLILLPKKSSGGLTLNHILLTEFSRRLQKYIYP